MFYKLILAKHEFDFQRLVNEALSNGWQLAGGVDTDETNYNQAVFIEQLPEGEVLNFSREPIQNNIS